VGVNHSVTGACGVNASWAEPYKFESVELMSDLPCAGGIEYLHRSLASRKRRQMETQCPGVYLGTLFLGDIHMGTWPSRLGESQELGQ
jgi:hypothetical protein